MNLNISGRWATALASHDSASRQALSELAGAYWYPIYAFFRASGAEGESAASLAETVLSRLIDEPATGAPLLREWMLDLAKSALAEPAPREPLLTIDRDWAAQRFAAEGTDSPRGNIRPTLDAGFARAGGGDASGGV